ncbi:thioredoxin [Streptomyces sp. NPDC048527]|uniref:thioredoxin n=1 Tax=Streptomyces sp. NPDC048527 TaxID=3365568 RepID=UPI003715B67D
MSSAKDVTDATFQAEVVNSDKTILVDFWAAWCGPCRAISPVLDQIAAEHPDDITLVKVNVDENPTTTESHSITSIPTLQVYRNGQVQKTLVGAMPKPQLEEELAEFLPD